MAFLARLPKQFCHGISISNINISRLTVHIDGGGRLHDVGLGDGPVPHGAPVRGVIVLLPGHEGEHGGAGLGAGGAGDVERLQLLVVSVPGDGGGRGPAHAGAGQVERLALGDCLPGGGEAGLAGGQQHHQLHRHGVQLVTRAALHLPALEVAVVSLVGRALDPQVISPKLWLVINTENKNDDKTGSEININWFRNKVTRLNKMACETGVYTLISDGFHPLFNGLGAHYMSPKIPKHLPKPSCLRSQCQSPRVLIIICLTADHCL